MSFGSVALDVVEDCAARCDFFSGLSLTFVLSAPAVQRIRHTEGSQRLCLSHVRYTLKSKLLPYRILQGLGTLSSLHQSLIQTGAGSDAVVGRTQRREAHGTSTPKGSQYPRIFEWISEGFPSQLRQIEDKASVFRSWTRPRMPKPLEEPSGLAVTTPSNTCRV